VIDAADPAALRVLGQHPLHDQPAGLDVEGGLATALLEDSYGNRPAQLVLLDVADPERIGELARVELPGSWVMAHRRTGELLVVVTEMGDPGWSAEVTSFDLADPAHPRLLGQLDLPFLRPGTRVNPVLAGQGVEAGTDKELLLPGPTLLLAETRRSRPPELLHEAGEVTLHFVDPRDPARPGLAASLPLPRWQQGPDLFFPAGELLVASHFETLPGEPAQVRWYLDRIDVHEPLQPRLLPPVAVPGQTIAFDPGLVAVPDEQLRPVGRPAGEGVGLLAHRDPDLRTRICAGLPPATARKRGPAPDQLFERVTRAGHQSTLGVRLLDGRASMGAAGARARA